MPATIKQLEQSVLLQGLENRTPNKLSSVCWKAFGQGCLFANLLGGGSRWAEPDQYPGFKGLKGVPSVRAEAAEG